MAVQWTNQKNKKLVEAFMSVNTGEQMQSFLRDLLTEDEIAECANRLHVASLLLQGVSYVDIEKETKMSSTTIARISKWLHQGAGGYRAVLAKISSHK